MRTTSSQVTDIIHAEAGGVLQSLGYTYDLDGQRTAIAREDGTRICSAYEDAHGLTGEDWLDVKDGHPDASAYARIVSRATGRRRPSTGCTAPTTT